MEANAKAWREINDMYEKRSKQPPPGDWVTVIASLSEEDARFFIDALVRDMLVHKRDQGGVELFDQFLEKAAENVELLSTGTLLYLLGQRSLVPDGTLQNADYLAGAIRRSERWWLKKKKKAVFDRETVARLLKGLE